MLRVSLFIRFAEAEDVEAIVDACPNAACPTNANAPSSNFCSQVGAVAFECPVDEAMALLTEESDHGDPVATIGFRIGSGLLHCGDCAVGRLVQPMKSIGLLSRPSKP